MGKKFTDISVTRKKNESLYKNVAFEINSDSLVIKYKDSPVDIVYGNTNNYTDDDFKKIQSEVVNSMEEYSGDKLGSFFYDKRKFEIQFNDNEYDNWVKNDALKEAQLKGINVSSDVNFNDYAVANLDKFDYLVYIGDEKDPRNIILPEGLKDKKSCIFNNMPIEQACISYQRNTRPLPGMGVSSNGQRSTQYDD